MKWRLMWFFPSACAIRMAPFPARLRGLSQTLGASCRNLVGRSVSSHYSVFERSQRLITTSMKSPETYGAQQITVLEGLEPVRKRPGMYIGSTGPKGLHHLIFEVVDNSIDEVLAGHCDAVHVTLEKDGSCTVSDNGRGIPCETHPTTGKSALETVLTVLHAGGKFGGDGSGYKISGGLHGVGVSVVNALSEWMEVEVRRFGSTYSQRFVRGVAEGPLDVREEPEGGSGTKVRFMPDHLVFRTGVEFDYSRIAGRMDELAYLNAGVKLVMTDLREGLDSSGEPIKREHFCHEGGIKEFVGLLCDGKTNLYPDVPVVMARGEYKNVHVEACMRWSSDMFSDLLVSFANGIRTQDGGTHLEGLKSVITRTINGLGRKSGKIKEQDGNTPGEFIREGLTAVINIQVPEAEFEGQTKNRLGNPEVRGIVDQVVGEGLLAALEWHPKMLSAILEKSSRAAKAAAAAKAARDMVRRKSLLTSTILPGKLADCSSRDTSETEIYIVEGDSAAGSAKQGRDRRTQERMKLGRVRGMKSLSTTDSIVPNLTMLLRVQAILPLRGKILNVEKCSTEKIYQNVELQALISALGLGAKGGDLDVAKLRYGRIIIMTDADVDGAHIRLLLLTFFWRYQRELITGGHVYVACPPLFKVQQGKSVWYEYSEDKLSSFLRTLPVSPTVTVQRFKGLGEMMPAQLWDTTMNPSTRMLKVVEAEDAAIADKTFSTLMGDVVAPRREFIHSHSPDMQLQDLDF